MGQMIKKILDVLARAIEIMIGVILILMVVVVTVEIFARYVLGTSMRGSFEIARYLLIWICFLGPSQGIRRAELISITMVKNALPPAIAKQVTIGTIILMAAFLSIVIWYGIEVTSNAALQESPALGINMAIPYLAIPIGSFLILVFLLESLVRVWKAKF